MVEKIRTVQVEQAGAFLDETRLALTRAGALIYPLTGLSVADLKRAGKPFWTGWYRGQGFEDLRSRQCEAAVFPNQLLLPASNRRSFEEQQKLMVEFSQALGRRIPGVMAVIGSVADYAELVFVHLAATGQSLFGADWGYSYTRTTTPTGDNGIALIGRFTPNGGLNICGYNAGGSLNNVWVAPLIVVENPI